MRKANSERQMTLIELLKNLRGNNRGATALEYGLILGLIVVVMVVGMTALGHQTASQWNTISSQVSSAVAQATS